MEKECDDGVHFESTMKELYNTGQWHHIHVFTFLKAHSDLWSVNHQSSFYFSYSTFEFSFLNILQMLGSETERLGILAKNTVDLMDFTPLEWNF